MRLTPPLDVVVGKGVNLIRLTRAGFRVPGGFVVCTDAYHRFVAANQLSALIARALVGTAAADTVALARASRTIREAFSRGAISAEDAVAIRLAAREWLEEPLAVRSSAVAEDLPDASFAGQHDSYLNVIGEPALLDAVKDCWSSLWTGRAIGYRLRNHIPGAGAALAVVVQRLVPAEVAGVMFTANPLTGRRSQTVIDATFGLGEALVSGAVEPDNFVVDSKSGRVVEQTTGAKATATVARQGGGVETVPAPSDRPTLTRPQLAELAAVGNRIQGLYGAPQDIEWAIAGGELYVLQARAITSLFPVPAASDDRLAVWMSFGAVQGMLEPMTPLGQDAIRHLFGGAARMFGSRLDLDRPSILGLAGERLWVRLDFVLRNPLGRRLAPRVLRLLEPSVGRIVAGLRAEPGLGGTVPNSRHPQPIGHFDTRYCLHLDWLSSGSPAHLSSPQLSCSTGRITMRIRKLAAGLVLLLAGAVVVGCSSAAGVSTSSTSASPTSGGAAEPITVVASTNVWGDLAAGVGGDKVTVTSIINDPSQDPHEYQASGQNQLALSKAKVVIENGGGYDDFIATMLKAVNNSSATVLNAVTISGKTTAGGEEMNEHVWYDFPTVLKVVDRLQSTFSSIDADNAGVFAANATKLKDSINAMVTKQGELKTQLDGTPLAITEPVPLYLLEAMGLQNKTPEEFSEAIEEDSDVPPTVLRETLALFSGKAVKLLAYNEQTTGAATEEVLKAAKDNGIPVVGFTETLPEGKDYVSWMTSNIEAVQSALQQ